MYHFRMPRTLPLALAAALTLGPLAACGTTPTESTTPSATATTAARAITLEDGWVKATSEDMTAVFGTLKNPTDEDVVITGGDTPVAGMVQAHVMTKGDDGQMTMKEAKDGFTVPAGGTFVLEPGGAHLMLMDLTKPVRTGDDVPITVTTKDGASIELSAMGRKFTGAEETYDPAASPTSHSSSH